MKSLRYLLAICLVLGLSGIAKADDFQAVVIDPIPSNLVIPILADNFSVTLSPCDPSQLPSSLVGTYVGCFTGENETGSPITSLQVLIPVFSYNGPQTAGCAFSGTGLDLFTSVTCGTTSDGNNFFLDFSGGNIPSAILDCDNDGDRGNDSGDDQGCSAASLFTIAEAGVDPAAFPQDFSVTANAPEPSSFWLMSTGVLSIGLFGAYRRRQSLLLAHA
jgi:hypothetical protein